MSTKLAERFILRISCRDEVGIVAEAAGFLAARQLFIVETANFGDPNTGLFFMRTVFTPRAGFTTTAFRSEFEAIAKKWSMAWELRDARAKPNVLILVSKQDHCLNDLLYRWRIGALPVDIVGVVSNHFDYQKVVVNHDIPFHHIKVTKANKPEAEARLLAVVEESAAELIVLARYMQVLSDRLCQQMSGRIINIHHSFLPSFKGANPYKQAYERGVKLIGATAHFVTADLDHGPIIAQAVVPVLPGDSEETLAARVLAREHVLYPRAVRWFVDDLLRVEGSAVRHVHGEPQLLLA